MAKFKKITQLAILLTSFMVLSFFIGSDPANANYRILIEDENYQLEKYEPREGSYLGAYVYQDTLIDGNMAKFNELSGKNHASFFLYVGYGRPAPVHWLAELEEVDAFAHIAWEPNDGLDHVQDDDYLRNFAKDLAAFDMPIFLRFASEMNGDWTAYSGNPQKYIEKWRLVHKVMKEEAPNVIMLWTVFTFPQNSIQKYYPGDDYVDWVGVNIYNVVYHNDDLRQPAAHEDPLQLLDYVYNTFSHKKPIQISEYGVTHYTITDDKEYIDFAVNKLSRLYRNLPTKYPRVKSIYYFNVNNLVNAPEGRRINNYALTDNATILDAYKRLVSNDHYLSEAVANEAGKANKEYMVLQKPSYTVGGKIYVSAGELENYLDLKFTLSQNNRSLKVNKAGKETLLPLETQAIYRGQAQELYLPLRNVAEQLGYIVNFDGYNQLIKVFKM